MFSTILKALRKEKKVTQIQLAEAIGVSAGNVGDWENGKSRPNYSALVALSRFFDVSADILLGIERKERGMTEREEYEEKLLSMMREMDVRDLEDIYGLASMKYERSHRQEV